MVVVYFILGRGCHVGKCLYSLCEVQHNGGGKEKAFLLLQYEFRKQIALAWIAPDMNDPHFANREATKCKRKLPSPSQSIANNSSQSHCAKLPLQKSPRSNLEEDVMDKQPATWFTDSSLGIGGSLSMHLCTEFKHWPALKMTPKAKCHLHCWVSSCIYRARILWCRDFQVHLCVGCFSTFHDIEDLIKPSLNLSSRNNRIQCRQRGRLVTCLLLPHKQLKFDGTNNRSKNETDS